MAVDRLRHQLGLLIHAVRFLTRVPVPDLLAYAPDLLGHAARYFGLVGVFVGAVGAAIWAGALWLGLPPLAAAGLALAATLLTTGGLHEDGLADCADGLGGGTDRDRALEIMRDSRIGTYGALALGMSLLLRLVCLAALGPVPGAAALVIAATLGRAAMVPALLLMPYARVDGLASGAARAAGAGTGMFALGTAAVVAISLGGIAGLVALAVGSLAWIWVSWRLMRRLGGYTGDGLGATEQVVEIAVFLSMAALWA